MPRRKRLEVPGMPHHVVQRGVNRQPVFLDQDCFQHYLHCLGTAAAECSVNIHAWCLMSNHVHLLITPLAEGAMSRLMQDVNRSYVPAVNKRFERTGHLWSGRFFASLVAERAYFFCCMRYIEFNPVRASIVSAPDDYAWSSWHSNARGRHSSLLTPHAEYLALGESPQARQLGYRSITGVVEDLELLEQLRGATRQNAAFCSAEFIAGLQAQTPHALATKPRGRPRKGV